MFKNWKGCFYQGPIHLGTQLQYNLRASSPLWARKASLARTRERACSQAIAVQLVLPDIMWKYLVYQYTRMRIQNIGFLFWERQTEWKHRSLQNAPMYISVVLIVQKVHVNQFKHFKQLGHIQECQKRDRNRSPSRWIKHRRYFAPRRIYGLSWSTFERSKPSDWSNNSWTSHDPWSVGLCWSAAVLCVLPNFFIATSSLHVGLRSQQRIKRPSSTLF